MNIIIRFGENDGLGGGGGVESDVKAIYNKVEEIEILRMILSYGKVGSFYRWLFCASVNFVEKVN